MRVATEALSIMALVGAVGLGAIEVTIHPDNRRETINLDFSLMHSTNVVLASINSTEICSTMGAPIRGRGTKREY